MFEGKTAVVTGAGKGLDRQWQLHWRVQARSLSVLILEI